MLEGLLWLLAGLALLTVGSEGIVRGASRVAAAFGVSPMMLGLTVVAIGTSMPELAVGITAANQQSGALAIGNIAGTNVMNILFILGLSALLKPLSLQLRVLRLDLPVMLVAAIAMALLAWDGVLDRLDGALLLVGAVGYTVALIRVARRESRAVRREFRTFYGVPHARGNGRRHTRDALLLLAGMALTVLGAEWLVKGASAIARGFGVSEAVIGLTIVAIGTSAPELVTTVLSTLKGERDVAIGNLLGSSIYNIVAILGLTCVIATHPLAIERELLVIDVPLMAGVALLCVPVFVTGRMVSREEGALFVGLYLAYLGTLLGLRA